MSAASELTERFLGDVAALRRRQAEANRVIAASGAAHLIHGTDGPVTNGPWSLDPIPLVLGGDVFDHLAAAVRERVAALELLLADLYGQRQVVRDGLVPAEALAASPRYRLAAVGVPPPPRWLVSYAIDVIADADGTWRIVQDLTDTPTGIAYALLDRSVMARVAAELLGPAGAGDLASISAFPAELRRALAGVTTAPSPRIVLSSVGIADPAYVEHSALARLLGFHLVESPDLVVRQRRLWLRTLGGLDPIDVVYRRTADCAVDPIELSATGTAGVPGLLYTTAEGGVVLANAHGAGVLEDPELAGFWPGAIAALTGSRPALDLLEGGGATSPFADVPLLREGRVVSSAVVVRLHAVSAPDGVVVMAGGNGRVLAPGDDPRRPTARLAKDVWVLGTERAAAVMTAPLLPQVDLAASVPTRAADALFWVGRAAERAEALARTARVVAARRQQDPGLASLDAARWAGRMTAVLRGLGGRSHDSTPPDPRSIRVLDAELVAAGRAVAKRLGNLVAGAATVAEYLSAASGRVLESLAERRDEFSDGGAPIDALDAVLADLAAFAGLWSESTVRGPAWRFGDIGRRVERALVILELVEGCLGGGDGERGLAAIDRDDVVDLSALEILLAANDSLVAYRRRHRSDVELDAALALLLRDGDNPRSFAASVQRLVEHATAVHWSQGAAAATRLARLGDGSPPDIERAHEATSAFAALVRDSWFATPVNPMLVRARFRRGAETA
jgi:uncharacterized circularly permuted ATP-grasp superfamily protein/uncharacterized alpha-E superfamily protein